nr:RecName: Full=Oncorhyncin-1; AltName: Full=Oncorhyncin I [Oncorhynchus mykiss]
SKGKKANKDVELARG